MGLVISKEAVISNSFLDFDLFIHFFSSFLLLFSLLHRLQQRRPSLDSRERLFDRRRVFFLF